MKKMLLILTLVILTSCSMTNNQKTTYNINSFNVDMSEYKNMDTTDHHFKGISSDEFIKAYENGGNGIFYIGYSGCYFCQEMVQYLETAAKELNKTVYYIDAYSDDSFTKNYNKLIDILDEFLIIDESGTKSIYTPHVFVMIDGNIVESHIGEFSDSAQENIDSYKKIISVLK